MANVKNYKEQGGEVQVIEGELRISGGKITANGTQATHIPDAASGTEITTINAILLALENVGILAKV